MIKYLPLVALLVGAQAHAGVIAVSDEAQVANMLFNGCSAQRAQMGVQEIIKQANPGDNPAVTDLIIKGYKFGIDYPNVGCNQFFTVVIDQLVNARSKA
ncbi:hypothetical protein [Escherichia coli]|uniref:hypothetical protein n=1 Tax=Escherichia coli TaxID=562 RepID=UPI0021C6CFD4|nr:hypothetical protein [Escherichia coli]MCQ6539924.1 hypothetical protein [Escherichia coli]